MPRVDLKIEALNVAEDRMSTGIGLTITSGHLVLVLFSHLCFDSDGLSDMNGILPIKKCCYTNYQRFFSRTVGFVGLGKWLTWKCRH